MLIAEAPLSCIFPLVTSPAQAVPSRWWWCLCSWGCTPLLLAQSWSGPCYTHPQRHCHLLTKGSTEELQQPVQHKPTLETRTHDTFANVFPEIEHPLQDSIPLLCHFHVFINLMEKESGLSQNILDGKGSAFITSMLHSWRSDDVLLTCWFVQNTRKRSSLYKTQVENGPS